MAQEARVPQQAEKAAREYYDTPETPVVSPGEAHPALIQRAIENPSPQTLTRDVVLALQRTHGNRFVADLVQRAQGASAPPPRPESLPLFPIQAKLTVTPAGDQYEQEADRVASQVMRAINAPAPQPTAQRQGEDEEEDEEELQLQRAFDPTGSFAAPPDVETSIRAARGSGQPLPEAVRAPMEQAFGTDFGGVRVHADAEADTLNRAVQARAFTTGHDIFFKQGTYDPGSAGGKKLLAHELTHVVQQTGSSATGQLQRTFDQFQRLPGLIDLPDGGTGVQLRGEVGITASLSKDAKIYPLTKLNNRAAPVLLKLPGPAQVLCHDIGHDDWMYVQIPQHVLESAQGGQTAEVDAKKAKENQTATVGLVAKGIRSKLSTGGLKHKSFADQPVFPQDPSVNDIQQRGLGDCYFLAALGAVVRSDPSLIREMLMDLGDGTVAVRFYRMTKDTKGHKLFIAEYVRIRKSLVVGSGGKQVYQNSENEAIWPGLIVKAYAAWDGHAKASLKGYKGTYAGIEGGDEHDAWAHLLGRGEGEKGTISTEVHGVEGALPGDPGYIIQIWGPDLQSGYYKIPVTPDNEDQVKQQAAASFAQATGQDQQAIATAIKKTFPFLRVPAAIALKAAAPAIPDADITNWIQFVKVHPYNEFLGPKMRVLSFDVLYKAFQHPNANITTAGQIAIINYAADKLDFEGTAAVPIYSKQALALFTEIQTALANHQFVGAGTPDWGKGTGISGGENTSVVAGLAGSHAYEIARVEEDSHRKYIWLRNPWGNTGRGYDPNFKPIEVESGEFKLELSDFRRYFQDIYYSPKPPGPTTDVGALQTQMDQISDELGELTELLAENETIGQQDWVASKLFGLWMQIDLIQQQAPIGGDDWDTMRLHLEMQAAKDIIQEEMGEEAFQRMRRQW